MAILTSSETTYLPKGLKATGTEPTTSYAATYPYNKTITTESGHAIELDDTPGHERLHVYHKSGTYVEVNNQGRMVTKVVDGDFEVIVKDKTVYIAGNYKIQVGGDIEITAGGEITLKGSKINLNP